MITKILLGGFFSIACITMIHGETYIEDWDDSARRRTVPVRIYLPEKDLAENKAAESNRPPYPVVLLSHGLGGSREGFPYLGEYWAAHGYVVIVMQHPGSDQAVWKERDDKPVMEALRSAVNAQTATDRVEDVQFVLDELERRNRSESNRERLRGLLDLDRIGIGGHSFGSHTTLASVGRFPYSPDPRFKAAIAMSPAGPKEKEVDPQKAFQKIRVPVLHFTGTKDVSQVDPSIKPSNRRVPFDHISGADQYLVIFKDGNHMLFSGHRRPFGTTQLERKYQPMIREISLRFLDAYLKGDAEAKRKLAETASILKDDGTFESKIQHYGDEIK